MHLSELDHLKLLAYNNGQQIIYNLVNYNYLKPNENVRLHEEDVYKMLLNAYNKKDMAYLSAALTNVEFLPQKGNTSEYAEPFIHNMYTAGRSVSATARTNGESVKKAGDFVLDLISTILGKPAPPPTPAPPPKPPDNTMILGISIAVVIIALIVVFLIRK